MAHVGGYGGVDPREKIDYMFKVVMIGDSGVGESQLKQLHHHAENDVFVILIGNKSDLRNRRQVRKLEAIELAQEEGLFFMETSALTEAAFLQFITEIFNSKTKKKLVTDEAQENSNPVPASLRGKIINPAQEIPAKTNMCCTQ